VLGQLLGDEEGKNHWLPVIDWEFFQLWRRERIGPGPIRKTTILVIKDRLLLIPSALKWSGIYGALPRASTQCTVPEVI
jgi:hypothetical protein